MLVATSPVAQPSDLSVSVLITGVGLSLIAAILFMGSNFSRNSGKQINDFMTRSALAIACLGATAVAIGTIQSLGASNRWVNIVGVANLIAALAAIGFSFQATRYSRFIPGFHEEHSREAPEKPGQSKEGADAPEPVESPTEDACGDDVEEEGNSVIDGRVSEPIPNPGQRRQRLGDRS